MGLGRRGWGATKSSWRTLRPAERFFQYSSAGRVIALSYQAVTLTAAHARSTAARCALAAPNRSLAAWSVAVRAAL